LNKQRDTEVARRINHQLTKSIVQGNLDIVLKRSQNAKE